MELPIPMALANGGTARRLSIERKLQLVRLKTWKRTQCTVGLSPLMPKICDSARDT
jgi:hypothetical protein